MGQPNPWTTLRCRPALSYGETNYCIGCYRRLKHRKLMMEINDDALTTVRQLILTLPLTLSLKHKH